MEKKKLVVIGGDAAGMGAASKVRREKPEWEIVVFEKGEYTSYAACGLPYYIAGDVESAEDLIARTPEVFREKQNIDVRIFHQVTAIDAEGKKVKVKNLTTGEEFSESWDYLLIGTGASAILPEVRGTDAEGVYALSVLQSGIDIRQGIEKLNPAKVVVIGAGYIGIEMAEAFLALRMDVTVVDMADQVMISMDEDMATIIADYMKEKGVHLITGEKLVSIEKNEEGKVMAVVTNKQTLEADLVILGLGVKPNTEMAEKAGLEMGVRGAIRVNKKLETSVPGIWAAGDCAESWHLLKKQQVFIPLGTVANKHALVAGINISGGNAEFPGVLGTAITRFMNLEISRTGLSEKEAKEAGIDYKSNTIESSTLSGYFPGTGKIHVKLVTEKKTGTILGGQIVGFNGAAKRIDTIATAITAGLTAQQLVDLDLSYAPPFSPVWDPVQVAARTLL